MFPCHCRFLQSPKNTKHIPFLAPVMLIKVKRMTKKTKVAKGFLNGLGPFLLYKSQLAFTTIHPSYVSLISNIQGNRQTGTL
jgi:hypothetical protein